MGLLGVGVVPHGFLVGGVQLEPRVGVQLVQSEPPVGVGVVHGATTVVLLTHSPQHLPGAGGSNSKPSGQEPKMSV